MKVLVPNNLNVLVEVKRFQLAELVKPMREHLTQVGFEELHTA